MSQRNKCKPLCFLVRLAALQPVVLSVGSLEVFFSPSSSSSSVISHSFSSKSTSVQCSTADVHTVTTPTLLNSVVSAFLIENKQELQCLY